MPDPLWPEAGWILAWGVPGALAGALPPGRLDDTALQLLVTATVLATLLTALSKGV